MTALQATSWQRERSVEKSLTQIFATDEYIRTNAIAELSQEDPGSAYYKRTMAAAACAEKIIKGTCDLYMLRKRGPKSGNIVGKLRLEQLEQGAGSRDFY